MSSNTTDQYQEIVQALYELLERLPTKDVELTEQTNLVADMGMDSINMMELLQEIEDRFDVIVPLNAMADVSTVQDLANEVHRLVEVKS